MRWDWGVSWPKAFVRRSKPALSLRNLISLLANVTSLFTKAAKRYGAEVFGSDLGEVFLTGAVEVGLALVGAGRVADGVGLVSVGAGGIVDVVGLVSVGARGVVDEVGLFSVSA